MSKPPLTLELSADVDISALPLKTKLVRGADPQTQKADIIFQLALNTEKWKGQLQLASLTSKLLGSKTSAGLGKQFKLENISLSTFAAEVFIQKKSFTIVAAIDTGVNIIQIVTSEAVFDKANAESKQPFGDEDKRSINLGVFIQKRAEQKPVVCFFVYRANSDGSDDLYTISSTPDANNVSFVSLEAKLDKYPRLCSLPKLPPTSPTEPIDWPDWIDWITPIAIGAGAVTAFLGGAAGAGEAGAAGGLAGLIGKILASGAGRVPGAGGEPVGEPGNASGPSPNSPSNPPPPVAPIGIGSARVGIDLAVG
ncbi:MAG: hypothetical protein KME07_22395 [Pegethrix bostrychoides GSE-TBD4-15B]|jgi:hypothetical protein|uniref:Uncharacterized protein n=1 Tax=Pegethrix bostrychoides GSE-TBD4-15B TaxID=2839662 RepID=A0A951PEJ1_9CYAN|nr:hypothetical protein [Pegethrix bostrychoides GSE-TBD4-15B]